MDSGHPKKPACFRERTALSEARRSSAVGTGENSEIHAVVMFGTYGPCAESIKLVHKTGFNRIFVDISFVGANARFF